MISQSVQEKINRAMKEFDALYHERDDVNEESRKILCDAFVAGYLAAGKEYNAQS